VNNTRSDLFKVQIIDDDIYALKNKVFLLLNKEQLKLDQYFIILNSTCPIPYMLAPREIGRGQKRDLTPTVSIAEAEERTGLRYRTSNSRNV
jgi:hypothetical protein